MQDQTPTPQTMPAALSYVLTHRLPCATLMVVMLMCTVWLPSLAEGAPVFIAMLLTTVGLSLNILAPALIAMVAFGGGLAFAASVAAMAATGITLITGFALAPGLVVFVLYGLIPILGAVLLMRSDGVRRSAQYLAFGLGGLTLLALAIAAAMQDTSISGLIDGLLAPMFDSVQQQVPAGEPEAAQMLEQSRQMMVEILPGLLALGVWFTWWGDVIFARNFARKYGFYQGEATSLLSLGFGKPVAYLFLVLMVLMNLAAGELHYIAVNAAILIGGLLATQGVAVGHSWLKAKGMLFSIAMMYLMLIVWSILIIPFVIIGLMDIWFDYRRNMPAVGG
ncbi:MAG: DUF2232 domain-containing protein [Mariprofundus sp.]|nr:DUF2232 domain-containing protein [Mariprofundus sp.]